MNAQVILIAENNEDDVLLLKRALTSAGIQNDTRTVANGEDTIRYLKGEGRFANRLKNPFPILLILNLQMPRKNGGEVLAWISTQTGLPTLKLIVTTGISDPKQTQQAVYFGAKRFLAKPPDPAALLEFLREIEGLSVVRSGEGYFLQLAVA